MSLDPIMFCDVETKKKNKPWSTTRSSTFESRTVFLQDKHKIPQSISMFSVFRPSIFFFLFFIIYSSPGPPRGGSGSGNRSVTCHYWSNSVICHRALTVCSALRSGTAGVRRTGLEIRFRHARKQENRVCVRVCVCEAETKVQRQWSRNDSQYGISQ